MRTIILSLRVPLTADLALQHLMNLLAVQSTETVIQASIYSTQFIKILRPMEAKAQCPMEAKTQHLAEAKTQRTMEAKIQRLMEAKIQRPMEAKTQRPMEASRHPHRLKPSNLNFSLTTPLTRILHPANKLQIVFHPSRNIKTLRL